MMIKSLRSVGVRISLFIAFLSCVYTIYAGIDPTYTLTLTQRFLCAACFILPMGFACMLLCQSVDDEIKRRKINHIFWIILFTYYLLQLLYMLYFASEFERSVTSIFHENYGEALQQQWQQCTNLVPFHTIRLMIQAYDYQYIDLANINLLGNLVAFMPFAFFLPKLFPSMQKPKKFLAFMAGLIILVEVLQLITLTGTLDIDDFILNMAGVTIFYGLLKIPFCQQILLLHNAK